MRSSERVRAAEAKANAARRENAELKEALALAENEQLKKIIAEGRTRSNAERNYAAMIRRRAGKLADAGRVFEAILLLKTIGE